MPSLAAAAVSKASLGLAQIILHELQQQQQLAGGGSLYSNVGKEMKYLYR
jgi:hypothetical protein